MSLIPFFSQVDSSQGLITISIRVHTVQLYRNGKKTRRIIPVSLHALFFYSTLGNSSENLLQFQISLRNFQKSSFLHLLLPSSHFWQASSILLTPVSKTSYVPLFPTRLYLTAGHQNAPNIIALPLLLWLGAVKNFTLIFHLKHFLGIKATLLLLLAGAGEEKGPFLYWTPED